MKDRLQASAWYWYAYILLEHKIWYTGNHGHCIGCGPRLQTQQATTVYVTMV